ncbi:MAG TPA: DUF1003 domain-containing protein [Methylovirgula sp.]|nr:DUF1003 domain-containing protein [Methylovirgula sp.]
MRPHKNWHEKHQEGLTLGARLADGFAEVVGSWTFIIVQSVILGIWVILNLVAFIQHWDPYPFILLNLVLSFQAAYASPIIMMSQNRACERDREQAQHDYETNLAAKEEIEDLMRRLAALEAQKIDKLLEGMDMLLKQRSQA